MAVGLPIRSPGAAAHRAPRTRGYGEPEASYVQRHGSRFVAQLQEFARFASVSADPRRNSAVRACAEWLAAHLRSIGMERAVVVETARHPVVVGVWHASPGRPTLLVYGHYDVQPEGAATAWETPPFAAMLVGDQLRGRGVSDDKGQLFVHLKAIETLLRTTGRLPVNVTVVAEGEEEIGSPGLTAAIRARVPWVRADVVVASDTQMLGPGRPAITYGLRGLVQMDVEVRRQGPVLHAGRFGTIAPDPARALSTVLARLYDASGRIAIPGFYAEVAEVSDAERRDLRATGPDDAALERLIDSPLARGERGYTAYERSTIRPSLTVTSVSAGDPWAPTAAITTSARARVDVRLVPRQRPERVAASLAETVANLTPGGLRSRVKVVAAATTVTTDRHQPAVRAASHALRAAFGVSPQFVRSGGTIPALSSLHAVLGRPIVLVGFGLPDDRSHAANEKFDLPTFFRGIAASIGFIRLVGDAVRSHPP